MSFLFKLGKGIRCQFYLWKEKFGILSTNCILNCNVHWEVGTTVNLVEIEGLEKLKSVLFCSLLAILNTILTERKS